MKTIGFNERPEGVALASASLGGVPSIRMLKIGSKVKLLPTDPETGLRIQTLEAEVLEMGSDRIRVRAMYSVGLSHDSPLIHTDEEFWVSMLAAH